jgi:RNA polymerase sigma factor (sigma-70 family)
VADLPRSLTRLLSARTGDGTDDVDVEWRAFVAEHTRLLLHVARSLSATHDDAMDAYTFVLEQLRENECRRLREYAVDPRCKLTTWLVVVARRLCLDLYRQRYGRRRGTDSNQQRAVRRRLQDLVAEQIDSYQLAAVSVVGAELAIRQTELAEALEQAVTSLAPQDQLLLQLRFTDDLTAQEIARLLDFASPFHVYRRVNSILAELRHVLARRGVESSVP